MGERNFSAADHLQTVKVKMYESRKTQDGVNNSKPVGPMRSTHRNPLNSATLPGLRGDQIPRGWGKRLG